MNLNEMKKVKMHALSASEQGTVKTFLSLLKINYEFFKAPSPEAYAQFKKDIAPFLSHPYAAPVKARIAYFDKEIASVERSKARMPDILSSFSKDVAHLEQMFKAKNFKAGAAFAKTMDTKMTAMKQSAVRHEDVLKSKKNPFYIEDPFFFQTTDFVRSFSFDDMADMINIDLTKFKYSYLNFPQAKLDNFQYLVYFIQQLKDSPTAIELKPSEFNKWSDFVYLGDENYAEFKKLMDSYLHSNNKKLIPQLLSMLDSLPELKKANDKLKKTHSIVYRGLGGYGDAEPKDNVIVQQEKETKYVATSASKYVAKNFAKMIGHMESGRRSNWGVVIEYKVTPNAILFDTDAFGGIYGEDEILIDATKAKVGDMDWLEFTGRPGEHNEEE